MTLDQPVHLIQESRYFLHLVDDDPTIRGPGLKLTIESRGIPTETEGFRSAQQVIDDRILEVMVNPGRLSRAPRPEEKS
jgi:hypothetical protein